ncbi:speedy protein E4-like isoform X2 [Notamacropus eugenii]|uniref:speedy protein E4-like isoform X2 n=1 Tax=Notamacropus eugenii TaxID=9315 RepID=UPI003B6805CC
MSPEFCSCYLEPWGSVRTESQSCAVASPLSLVTLFPRKLGSLLFSEQRTLIQRQIHFLLEAAWGELSPALKIKEEVPGPSGTWIPTSSPPRTQGQKRKHSDCIPTVTQDRWAVKGMFGLKMQLKRRRMSTVRPEDHNAFNRLLEDPVVQSFLAWDTKLRVSDKYLLAMIVAYFARAGRPAWQYQRLHFFLALYLANDMEEDRQGPKHGMFAFLFGQDRTQRVKFQWLRAQLFRAIGWKAWVTREECEEVGYMGAEIWSQEY